MVYNIEISKIDRRGQTTIPKSILNVLRLKRGESVQLFNYKRLVLMYSNNYLIKEAVLFERFNDIQKTWSSKIIDNTFHQEIPSKLKKQFTRMYKTPLQEGDIKIYKAKITISGQITLPKKIVLVLSSNSSIENNEPLKQIVFVEENDFFVRIVAAQELKVRKVVQFSSVIGVLKTMMQQVKK